MESGSHVVVGIGIRRIGSSRLLKSLEGIRVIALLEVTHPLRIVPFGGHLAARRRNGGKRQDGDYFRGPSHGWRKMAVEHDRRLTVTIPFQAKGRPLDRPALGHGRERLARFQILFKIDRWRLLHLLRTTKWLLDRECPIR